VTLGELEELARSLEERVAKARAYLRVEERRGELAALEEALSEASIWSDPAKGRELSRRYGQLKEDVQLVERLESELADGQVALDLAKEDAELAAEAEAILGALERELEQVELRSLLAGEFDEGDAVIEIHAGAGGTDAQDWAQMLLRMYERWAASRGFDFELDEITEGQEAGILSATAIVRGRYAYGLLSAERGVHRLVRISPFDAQHRRQTSFASLDVTPLLEDTGGVEIDEKDLRIDTYRSSGAGGQHVNVTDSAVRITHLPTGIVVSVQNERSQLQNRAKAMQILISKLEERRRQEQRAALEAISGPRVEVGWANQARSYVLAPYQLVKDHRSGYEDRNVQAVLDGRIDPFIEAYLVWRRAHGGEGSEGAALVG